MKFILILLFFAISTVAYAQKSELIDYTQITPEHLSKLKDKMTFVDKHTNETYRVINRESSKGLEIQIIKNGMPRFVKHGVYYVYYEGYKVGLTTYHYGKRHGVKESYNKEGVVSFHSTYQNGIKQGPYQQRNDKDQLVNEVNYLDGKKHGEELSYYNEKIHFRKDWVNGKRHGNILQYNSKGKVVAKTVYAEGKKVGKTIWY